MRPFVTAAGLGLALLFSAWAGTESLLSDRARATPQAGSAAQAPLRSVEMACPGAQAGECRFGVGPAEFGPPPLEWR